MHEGRITGELDAADCNEQNVMQLAVGSTVACAKPASLS
jgi:ABC-type sugar transport system ATPase subunit